MMFLALVLTFLSLIGTALIVGANGMRSSPGQFYGGAYLVMMWAAVIILWVSAVFFK